MGGFIGGGSAIISTGFFGNTAAAPVGFQVTMGGPNSTGPWQNDGAFPFGATNDMGCYSANVGYGSMTPAGQVIHGAFIEAMGTSGDNPSACWLIVLHTGITVPQNFFTSLQVGAPLNLNLPTVGASYFNSNAANPGYTVWAWAETLPFLEGQTLSCSFVG